MGKIFKKSKDAYVYDIQSNKYYDFQYNSNIIGYSNKRLTNEVKNSIPSKWNLKGETIYHKRIRSLIKNIFGENYLLTSAFSLTEFISRLMNYSIHKEHSLTFVGERFNLWLNERFNKLLNNDNKKNIIVYDMAEFYLNAEGKNDGISGLIKNLEKNGITVFNYFWHPETEIMTEGSDIVILPEIYSGNFNYINILINKSSIFLNDINYLTDKIENVPSLYISSSLKNYYLIQKFIKYDIIKLSWDDLTFAKRLFSYNSLDEKNICNIYEKFYNKRILLSGKAPYYSYLPLTLEDYQKNFLSKIKL